MPITRGDPKNPEFIYRKLCILTFLYISHLQNTLPLMHYMYRDFFPLLKAVFELMDFDAFQCFHCFFFVLHLYWWNVSLSGLFSTRETKKVTQGKIGWVGRVGHQGYAVLDQKLLNTQRDVGKCTRKKTHHKMGKCIERIFKKIHWSQTHPLTTTPAGTLI